MRHNVHFFLGTDFKQLALNLKEYVEKYGEAVSPYFNVLLQEGNVHDEALIKRAKHSTTGEEQSFSFDMPVAVNKSAPAGDITSYFNQLFRELVNIMNPGVSSTLLLTLYFPLFDAKIVEGLRLIIEAVRKCRSAFEIDLIGLGADLRPSILGLTPTVQDVNEAQIVDIQRNVLQSVVELKREHRGLVSHLIPLFDVNSEGYALNLDNESLVRMLGELSITFVSNYDRFMRQQVDDDSCDITGIGLSQIYLDEYYFAKYLRQKAFLHVLEKENVTQEAVDLNKIAPISQKCLCEPDLKFDVRHIFSQFWDECKVENLLNEGKAPEVIIAELSPKIDTLFDSTLPDRIQSFIPDEELSLPERKCILALLLGQDDEQFYNDLYNDNQLYVDDIINEPMAIFVDENNRHKRVEQDDDGRQKVMHAVLDSPLDESSDVYIPLAEIRELKKRIFSSSKYIRTQEQVLEDLETQVKESKEADKRLSPNGFKFNNTVYRLQHNVTEHALQENYQAHEPASNSVDLRKFFSEIRNQGEEGACASFATVAVFEYFQHRYGIKDNQNMSPAFAYYNARMRGGNTVPGNGSSISDNIEAMHDLGVCHESLWEYNHNNIDQKPSDEAFLDAKSQTIIKALNVQIDENPDKTLRNMKSALCDGYPVLISLKVYNSFSAPHGIVPHPTDEDIKSADKDARHALVLCGYSDEHRFFIARNSWGKQFGDKGYCYIPYSYICDREHCECAFVITEVTPKKASFIAAPPLGKVFFDTTDVAIRKAVIKNLVAEERLYLSRLKNRYALKRLEFEGLFAKLCNNHTRTAIRDLAESRLNHKTSELKASMEELQTRRVVEVGEHEKTSRNKCVKLIAASVCSLLAAVLSFSVDFSYNDYFGYGLLSLSILLFIYVGFYIPYLRVKRKQLSGEFLHQINTVTDSLTKIEREQIVSPIKFHLAGAFLEQYDSMRNQLMGKYNCMLSFVGNLKVWHDEEKHGVEIMNTNSRPPFVAVLDNNTLDNYFKAFAQQATRDIHLADFFNRGYTLDESGIVKFWQELNDGMEEELMNKLNDFSMSKYILNEGNYPFLSNDMRASELLTELVGRSKTFLQWRQYENPTPEVKYLLLYFTDDREEGRWWDGTRSYFRDRPQSIPIDSRFKLVMIEIKNMRPQEITI